MKSTFYYVIIVLLCTSTSEILSKFIWEKVAGIEGEIRSINCGSNDYCYIVEFRLSDESSKFYKTDSKKTILSTGNFGKIEAVYLNDQDTAYVFESKVNSKEKNGETTELLYTLYMKKKDWNAYVIIYKWIMDQGKNLEVHLNKYNYLFITVEYGPVVIKPDRNVPIALPIDSAMLKFSSFESDTRGNVYFQNGGEENLYDSAFQITKEEPNIKILQAQSIPVNDKITSMGISNSDVAFFATSNNVAQPPLANIFKLKGRKLEPVLRQFHTTFYFICTTKNRLYFINEDSFISYIDDDDEVTAVQPYIPGIRIEKNKCKEDSEGSVFFPSQNTILKIEKGKTVVTKIVTPAMKNITSILIDQNNNLWIVAEQLYFAGKDSMNVDAVGSFQFEKEALIVENKRQAEVLIGTTEGLFSISYSNKSQN